MTWNNVVPGVALLKGLVACADMAVGILRVMSAFLYGVLLGVLWECASMGVLLAATLLEHLCGTLSMAVVFLGLAGAGFMVAARADLGRPLLSILAFRLTAQLAMTVGTGSVRMAAPSPPDACCLGWALTVALAAPRAHACAVRTGRFCSPPCSTTRRRARRSCCARPGGGARCSRAWAG